jgi:hypothetical protein
VALYEETGPADELAGLLWEHPKRPFAAFLGIGGLLLLVLVIVHDDKTLFQDDIETGFNVVVVEIVVIFVFGLDRHDVALDDTDRGCHHDYSVVIVLVEVVDKCDVAEVVVVIVLVEKIVFGKILEVRLIRVDYVKIVHLDGLFQI